MTYGLGGTGMNRGREVDTFEGFGRMGKGFSLFI